jgi:hypothetical protein
VEIDREDDDRVRWEVELRRGRTTWDDDLDGRLRVLDINRDRDDDD